MFIPPNVGNDDDKNRIADKPLPPLTPRPTPPSDDAPADGGVPQGDELFHYVLECMEKGSSKAEVRKQLIAFGYSAPDADQVVEDVAEWRRKHGSRYPDPPVIATNSGGGNGNTNMLIGGIVCLVGIVITVGSCMAAGEGGGRYFIAWGAIIWGAIQFFRGMSQSNQPS